MTSSQTDSGPLAGSVGSGPIIADSMLSKYRSPNCKPEEKAQTLFTYFARSGKDPAHEFHSFMLSCQPKNQFSHVDMATEDNMKRVAADAISVQHGFDISASDVKIDAHGIALGVQGHKNGASEVSRRRMASNCGPTWNLNSITAYNRFTCRYLGKGVDENGRIVQNPFQTWKGTLASCDDSLRISDDVENDIRHLAWEAAGGEEAKLDVNQFLCSIQSLPIQ